MSIEENKAVVRRFIEEVMNKGNLDVIDEICAEDAVDHNAPAELPPGPEGVKQMIAMYRNAFPDIHITIEDMVAEEDKVVARMCIRGTHRGELMGMAPTGKEIVVTSIEIDRIADGKVVEHWENFDELGMMRQLGALSEPEQGGKQ